MPFSPYPEMRDIYTAVQIRGQSAAALAAGARANDGRTATAGCVLRLARAVARALGNFAVNEIIGWTGAPLGRLPAPPPPPCDRRLCHFSISTALWPCRRPPREWRLAAALPARPTYRVAAAHSPCGSSPARPRQRRTRRARAEGSH